MLLGGLGRLAATLLVLQAAHVVGEVCPVNFKPNHAPPKVADGWAARVVAHGLKQPRGIVIDQSGALLIADEGVGIKRVTFDDKGGTCLVVKETQELVKDPEVSGWECDGADCRSTTVSFFPRTRSMLAPRTMCTNGHTRTALSASAGR